MFSRARRKVIVIKRRNHYKEDLMFVDMRERRGQVAIFVIVAIVILAVFIWLLVFPKLPVLTGGSEINPSAFVKNCLQPSIRENLDKITMQGGYFTPNLYVLYEGQPVQYLCYTSEDYKPCIVQQPLVVNHVADELKAQIDAKARGCMESLVERYKSQGYTVESSPKSVNVSIVSGSVEVVFNSPLTVSKQSTQTFRQFSIRESSELYDLLALATSIIQFESTLGDSETSLYVNYYPDLKIEKNKKEGDTIYTLTNVVSKDKFRFATRSLVWPSGYGVQK